MSFNQDVNFHRMIFHGNPTSTSPTTTNNNSPSPNSRTKGLIIPRKSPKSRRAPLPPISGGPNVVLMKQESTTSTESSHSSSSTNQSKSNSSLYSSTSSSSSSSSSSSISTSSYLFEADNSNKKTKTTSTTTGAEFPISSSKSASSSPLIGDSAISRHHHHHRSSVSYLQTTAIKSKNRQLLSSSSGNLIEHSASNATTTTSTTSELIQRSKDSVSHSHHKQSPSISRNVSKSSSSQSFQSSSTSQEIHRRKLSRTDASHKSQLDYDEDDEEDEDEDEVLAVVSPGGRPIGGQDGGGSGVESSIISESSTSRIAKKSSQSAWQQFILPSYRARLQQFDKQFYQKIATHSEKLLDDYVCALNREFLIQGRLYVSTNYVSFYSNLLGYETTVTISYDDILSVSKANTIKLFRNAIEIVTQNGDKLFFTSFLARDRAFKLIHRLWSTRVAGRKLTWPDVCQIIRNNYSTDSLAINLSDLEGAPDNIALLKKKFKKTKSCSKTKKSSRKRSKSRSKSLTNEKQKKQSSSTSKTGNLVSGGGGASGGVLVEQDYEDSASYGYDEDDEVDDGTDRGCATGGIRNLGNKLNRRPKSRSFSSSCSKEGCIYSTNASSRAVEGASSVSSKVRESSRHARQMSVHSKSSVTNKSSTGGVVKRQSRLNLISESSLIQLCLLITVLLLIVQMAIFIWIHAFNERMLTYQHLISNAIEHHQQQQRHLTSRLFHSQSSIVAPSIVAPSSNFSNFSSKSVDFLRLVLNLSSTSQHQHRS